MSGPASFEAMLIAEARRVARARLKCNRLRKDLKAAQLELSAARRDLKKIASAARDPFNQAPPVRGFDE